MDKFKYGVVKPDKIIYIDKEVDYHRDVDSYIGIDKHAIFLTLSNCTADAQRIVSEWDLPLEITITPDEHYVLPSEITVTGAEYTYNDSTGVITLSAVTDAVYITVVCLGEQYTITGSITNGSLTGTMNIRYASTRELYLVPSEGYELPASSEDITVTGASFTFDASTGKITLSNPTGNVTITAACPQIIVILGVSGEGSESGSLTRTDQAVGKSFSINSSTGLITSDFDDLFPYNEITEVEDSDGNKFVRIPKHYTKYEYDAETHLMTTRISNVQGEGYILNPCFKDDAGNVIDAVCVGKYDASGTSDKATSVTGSAPLVNITHANMRTACKANGTNYGMLDYWTWRMLQDLFKIEFATTNSQSIMRGHVDGSAAEASGVCDTIGENKSGWDLTKKVITYRGIENLYGNVNQWCDGMTFNSHNIYVCYDPTQYQSGTHTSPYELVGYQINPNGSGNPSQRGFDSDNPIVWESVATNGTDYDTGGYWFDYSTGGTNPCPGVGGYYGNGSNAGLWYMYAYGPANTDARIGGRLILRNAL